MDKLLEKEVKTIIAKDKKPLIYVLSFIIPVLCLLMHMFIENCYPFGDNTILCGDASAQYFSVFREWMEHVKSGGSALFSWEGGLGYEFYTTYWYYLASPFNWLIFLFGENHLELGMIVILMLQIGGCGITACYYFMHSNINKMEKGLLNNLLCVLFSLAYTMCNYFLAYQYNILWLISLMLMPLILLGIEKLVEKKDGRLYCITLFLAFVTNFYFAWFLCIFAVIWFIDQKKDGIRGGLKSFAHFAGLSILAAASAAAVLIPCYLFVLDKEDEWLTLSDYGLSTFGNIGDFVQGFFLDSEINIYGSDLFTYNNYCGIFILSLVIIYIFEKKIVLSQKVKRIAEILILSFSMNWIGTEYALHGFTIPHAFTNRFAFILIFILIITAFESVQAIETIRIRYIPAAILIFTVMFCIALFSAGDVLDIFTYLGTIIIFAYLCVCLFLLKRKSIKKKSFIINLLIIGFAELIVNSFMVNDGIYDYLREKEVYASDWSDDYQSIETDDGERKTAWMFETNCFQYSDTNMFSSVLNTDTLWLFKKMGLVYLNNGVSYLYRGTTPLTAALLNVDYVLTDNEPYFGGYQLERSYEMESVDGEYGLYDTAYDLELGFMVSENILDWDYNDENPFEVQNNFSNTVLEQENIFEEVSFDEMDIGTSFCILQDVSDNSYKYYNFDTSGWYSAGLKFDFTVPEDMNLYVYFSDYNLAKANITIDGEEYLSGEYSSPGTMINLGDLKEGQNVTISVYNSTSPLSEGETFIYFYKYNDDVMQDCLLVMSENSLILDTFSDAYVSGTVTAGEDGVLYTSIPYYRGWTLYVDGKETEITKIADALIGVTLTAGEHTIELKYFPYGLKLGIIISLIGIAGMILYFICGKRKTMMDSLDDEYE